MADKLGIHNPTKGLHGRSKSKTNQPHLRVDLEYRCYGSMLPCQGRRTGSTPVYFTCEQDNARASDVELRLCGGIRSLAFGRDMAYNICAGIILCMGNGGSIYKITW